MLMMVLKFVLLSLICTVRTQMRSLIHSLSVGSHSLHSHKTRSGMNAEREVITIALGNYSTLVAAQWANGLTQYDVEHDALFIRHSDGGSRKEHRVPRLVILDNHHASRIAKQIPLHDFNAPLEHLKETVSCEDGDEAEDDEVPFDDFSYITTPADASLVRRSHDDNNESDGDDDHDDGHRHHHCDPNAGNKHDEADAAAADERLRQRDATNAKALFRHNDPFIPWHHYIRTGLHNRSYALLLDGHNESRGGSLLHSVGYGKAQLHSRRNPEVEHTFDSTRYMLEASDHPQGCQFFVDGDSCFAGAGANLMEEVREEWGAKLPIFAVSSYEPFPELDMLEDDFAKVRIEEVALNFALSVHHLSQAASCFVPMCVGRWGGFEREMRRSLPHMPPMRNSAATAQVIAATWDTATYGLRVGGGPDEAAPMWYMSDMERVLRPSSGLRVASALTSLPLRVRHATDEKDPCFWSVLQRNPLFPTMVEEAMVGGGAPPPTAAFFPLSHTLRIAPERDSGRVLGHAVSLRGIKQLADVVYPRQEAILRYGFPLRTSTFHCDVVSEGYPVSDTFPKSVVLPSSSGDGSPSDDNATAASVGLSQVPMASHLCCTYNAGAMLHDAVTIFDKICRYRKHVHRDTYMMEDDEWRDISEELHQLSDDYCHADDACGSSDDGGDN